MGKSNTEKSHSKKFAVIQKPLLATTAVLFPLPLWAALPTPVAPSTAPAAGDWIGLIQGCSFSDLGMIVGGYLGMATSQSVTCLANGG